MEKRVDGITCVTQNSLREPLALTTEWNSPVSRNFMFSDPTYSFPLDSNGSTLDILVLGVPFSLPHASHFFFIQTELRAVKSHLL